MGHLLSSPWKGLKVTEILPGHTTVLVQWQFKSYILSRNTPDAILLCTSKQQRSHFSFCKHVFLHELAAWCALHAVLAQAEMSYKNAFH